MKNTKTNLVEFRKPLIFLRDVQLKVSEAGRQRVLREGRKNVHAGVVGHEIAAADLPSGYWAQARYNPYLMESFQVNGEKVLKSPYAILNHNGLWLFSEAEPL